MKIDSDIIRRNESLRKERMAKLADAVSTAESPIPRAPEHPQVYLFTRGKEFRQLYASREPITKTASLAPYILQSWLRRNPVAQSTVQPSPNHTYAHTARYRQSC